MEEHISAITEWFNHLFAPLALWMLHSLHVQPADYERPIPEYLVMCIITLMIGTLLALLVRSRLSVDRPVPFNRLRRCCSRILWDSALKIFWKRTPGIDSSQFIAFTGSISIFILLANLMGLIAFFYSRRRAVTL